MNIRGMVISGDSKGWDLCTKSADSSKSDWELAHGTLESGVSESDILRTNYLLRRNVIYFPETPCVTNIASFADMKIWGSSLNSWSCFEIKHQHLQPRAQSLIKSGWVGCQKVINVGCWSLANCWGHWGGIGNPERPRTRGLSPPPCWGLDPRGSHRTGYDPGTSVETAVCESNVSGYGESRSEGASILWGGLGDTFSSFKVSKKIIIFTALSEWTRFTVIECCRRDLVSLLLGKKGRAPV